MRELWQYLDGGRLLVVLCSAGLVLCGALLAVIGIDRAVSEVRRRLGRVDACLFAVAVALWAMFGGSKQADITDKTGADAGIGVAYAVVDVTNFVDVVEGAAVTTTATRVEIGWTNGTVTVDTPFWGKMQLTDDWAEIAKSNATVVTDVPVGGTNTLSFWVSGALSKNYYWLGSEPPRVITDEGSIDVVDFQATSHAATIKWTCSDASCTVFSVKMQVRNGAWTTLAEVEAVPAGGTNVFVRTGFTVGVTTTYKITGEYYEN